MKWGEGKQVKVFKRDYPITLKNSQPTETFRAREKNRWRDMEGKGSERPAMEIETGAQ